jgi:nitroreductase
MKTKTELTHYLIHILLLSALVFTLMQSETAEPEKARTDATGPENEPVSEEPQPKVLPDALSVIHSRKSVRHYTGKAVRKGQLDTLLRAGMAAPTARDKRPWEYIVVRDQQLLHQLSEDIPYGKMLDKAGAAICVCADMNVALGGFDKTYWIMDCSAATENILLAAEAIGLGAVWVAVSPQPVRVANVRETLELPPHVMPLNLISIGWPKGIEQPKNKWDPSNIHYEKW